MARDIRPKMSLLAQFDDIVRCASQLTAGVEDEFLEFVINQNECRKKWAACLREAEHLHSEVMKARKENDLIETKLKHMKSLLETEIEKRLKVENEKRSLERQIALIKEVLLADQSALNDQTKEKLAFLNNVYMRKHSRESSPRRLQTIEESMGSVVSASDVSFDKTDEDLDEVTGQHSHNLRSKRSSSSRHDSKAGSKKQKLQNHSEENCDSAEADSKSNSDCEDLPVKRVTRSNRYFNDAVSSENVDTVQRRESPKLGGDGFDDLIVIPEEPETRVRSRPSGRLSGSTPLRRLSSAGRINRAHVFCTKTVIRPETCWPCGRRIRFYKQAFKCQDCRATCHPECKDQVPLPCYPVMQTPTGKGASGTIADYTPSTSPMIPAVIVHCINEIESRGLTEVGLYRVSGSEREVRELKDKFLKGKCIPCLSKSDIHAVCGTVKEFLRSLQEPLVTRALWKQFVQVATELPENDKVSAVCKAVEELPQPNRDTLAFLIMHLNNIADSPKCKMPLENLAKVFGPTVVGYSTSDPSGGDMISETKCQFEVMLLLLKVPLTYWRKFIGSESDTFCATTPEPRPAPPEGKLLGPLSSSGYSTAKYKSGGVVVGKTPLTPRGNRCGSVSTRRQFFSSPLLK